MTDPLLDTLDCAECGKEFVPKKPGQKTCGTPKCNGAKGARLRDYKAPRGLNQYGEKYPRGLAKGLAKGKAKERER